MKLQEREFKQKQIIEVWHFIHLIVIDRLDWIWFIPFWGRWHQGNRHVALVSPKSPSTKDSRSLRGESEFYLRTLVFLVCSVCWFLFLTSYVSDQSFCVISKGSEYKWTWAVVAFCCSYLVSTDWCLWCEFEKIIESLTYNLRRSWYCLGIPNLVIAYVFQFEVQYPKTLFSFFFSLSVELIGEGVTQSLSIKKHSRVSRFGDGFVLLGDYTIQANL